MNEAKVQESQELQEARGQQMKEQKALVSFYVTPHRTLIFWLDAHTATPQVDHVDIEQAEIAAAAAELQRLFSYRHIHARRPEYTTDMAWLVPLGRKLLQPLADRLTRCKAMIVAPHAELHLLPFHLLVGEDGIPLGVTHSITYVANLSIYALLLTRAIDTQDFMIPSLCMSTAAQGEDSVIRETFAANPRAFAEKTQGMFLQGTDASWSTFQYFAERADSLYISCHGHFDSADPLESALLLSDGKTLPSKPPADIMPYSLSVRDILNMRIRSRLVVLDACTSGNEIFSTGDEPMGFPTAFLLSGANAVIATNWVVERNRGRYFMTNLVERWLSGVSLGVAMQYAYVTTHEKYPHPFHWAAFSLFGNDRLLFRQN